MSVDLPSVEETARALEIEEARRHRTEKLLAKRSRRRRTRARIILGGAVLAEIRDNLDPAFIKRIVQILDERVGRSRDRDDLGELIGQLLPERTSQRSAGLAKAELPDFVSIAHNETRGDPSIAAIDPDYEDVRALLGRSSSEETDDGGA